MTTTLTTAKVAEELDVSPQTVRRLANRGVLPSIRLTPTSPRRFRREAVDRLLRTVLHGEAASNGAARHDEEAAG